MDKNTFTKLSYGVYVVASGNRERQNAFIATTVFQVTAEPAKIVVACNKNNFTLELIRETKVFSASVLKQNYQPTTIGNFGFRSGKDFNKFEHCNAFFFGETTQAPVVLEDCLAWFECRLIDEVDVGTHILLVGEVEDAQITAAGEEPLTYSYYHKVKKGVTAKNAPSYIAEQDIQKMTGNTQYRCTVCKYVYDPETGDPDNGIAPGTLFADLPHDWTCPICGVAKSLFEPAND